MAIKTFTTGEVLTASDTNTYLANSGLVYITSGALSGTTTNFVGFFTSTYTNYRIVLDAVGGNGAGDVYIRMLNSSTPYTATEYFWAGTGFTSAGANRTTNGPSQSIGYLGTNIVSATTGICNTSVDVFNPQTTFRTMFAAQSAHLQSGVYCVSNVSCAVNQTNSFDGIQFLTNAAITMSGNVTIYGYRKA